MFIKQGSPAGWLGIRTLEPACQGSEPASATSGSLSLGRFLYSRWFIYKVGRNNSIYIIGCLGIKRNNADKKPFAWHIAVSNKHEMLRMVTIVFLVFSSSKMLDQCCKKTKSSGCWLPTPSRCCRSTLCVPGGPPPRLCSVLPLWRQKRMRPHPPNAGAGSRAGHKSALGSQHPGREGVGLEFPGQQLGLWPPLPSEPTLDDYLLPCHTASAPLGQTQGLCHLSGWGVAETPSTRGTACKGQHPLTYPQTPP